MPTARFDSWYLGLPMELCLELQNLTYEEMAEILKIVREKSERDLYERLKAKYESRTN